MVHSPTFTCVFVFLLTVLNSMPLYSVDRLLGFLFVTTLSKEKSNHSSDVSLHASEELSFSN